MCAVYEVVVVVVFVVTETRRISARFLARPGFSRKIRKENTTWKI